MDLALNNLQRLIYHKTQPTNQQMFYHLIILLYFSQVEFVFNQDVWVAM